MTGADRLSTDEVGMVIACPKCNVAGGVYRRRNSNTHIGDPDDPFACGKCSATFDEPLKRPSKRGGSSPKYGDLTSADLGLSGSDHQEGSE